MITTLEGGEGSASRPSRSLSSGKTRYPLYRKLGGPQSRSWQVRKISTPTGIGSPYLPAPSQSLYRPRYRAHICSQRSQLIPFNIKLNPIWHLPALLWPHPILHISRIRVKNALHWYLQVQIFCITTNLLGSVFILPIISVTSCRLYTIT
jgi:hypothetical protein